MLGRWLTRDPIGYRDGMNLYFYVHNSPINAVDSYGLISVQACNDDVSAARKNPKAKKILQKISDLKCATPTFTCCECKSGEGGHTDPTTGNVTLCANNISNQGGIKAGTVVIEDIVHELTHALDRCKKKDCFSDCKCRACSEIKAYDQSGACSKGGSLRNGYKTYRECIEHYACASLDGTGCSCDDVKNQLSTCMGLSLT